MILLRKKKAETTAEIQFIDAFRSMLLGKVLELKERNKPVKNF